MYSLRPKEYGNGQLLCCQVLDLKKTSNELFLQFFDSDSLAVFATGQGDNTAHDLQVDFYPQGGVYRAKYGLCHLYPESTPCEGGRIRARACTPSGTK